MYSSLYTYFYLREKNFLCETNICLTFDISLLPFLFTCMLYLVEVKLIQLYTALFTNCDHLFEFLSEAEELPQMIEDLILCKTCRHAENLNAV